MTMTTSYIKSADVTMAQPHSEAKHDTPAHDTPHAALCALVLVKVDGRVSPVSWGRRGSHGLRGMALIEALVGTLPRTDIRDGVARFVDWYRDYARL